MDEIPNSGSKRNIFSRFKIQQIKFQEKMNDSKVFKFIILLIKMIHFLLDWKEKAHFQKCSS